MTVTRELMTGRERELAELCMHEAGHAVAGVLLGGVLAAATRTSWEGTAPIAGRTTFELLPPAVEPQVAYAGVWAQACWRNGGRRPTRAQVFGVLAGTGHQDDRVLLASGGTAAASAVVPLVERCWLAVCTLAGKIAGDRVARHPDVSEALGLSADPVTAGVQLAQIRAGAAPGSFAVRRPRV